MVVRGGVTIDEATVGGPDADGNRVLAAGTVLGEVSATGKYGPYDNAAGDGRETAVGFLVEDVNLKDGVDVVTSILLHGSVIEARTSGVDANAKTDFAGAIIFQ
jgi:NDP-sugar pyrophosphorylase family protein